jgi:hypothetical protein
MLDRRYKSEEEYDKSNECDYFDRYSFVDYVTTTGVILSSDVVDSAGRFLGHWHGDITYMLDDGGCIIGYEYWTYEEDELWQTNEIRRDIDYLLTMYKRCH